jgi:hypothetical protein
MSPLLFSKSARRVGYYRSTSFIRLTSSVIIETGGDFPGCGTIDLDVYGVGSMYALVSPEKIQLPSGAIVRLPATWQDYQLLCQWATPTPRILGTD